MGYCFDRKILMALRKLSGSDASRNGLGFYRLNSPTDKHEADL